MLKANDNTRIKKLLEEVLRTIDIVIQTALNGMSFNYYITGRIKTVNGDATYLVTIDEKDETLKAREGVTLNQGDIVFITVPNRDRSHAFIDCKRLD